MSFLSDTRTELCSAKTEKKALAVAECYGILLYCRTFTPREIRISTGSDIFAARLPRLFHRAFGLEFDRLPESDSGTRFTFLIHDPKKLSVIYQAFGYDAGGVLTPHVNFAVLEAEGSSTAFIRGAFLAGGSVSDPENSFHLELATSHSGITAEVHSILLDLGLSPKESRRGANSLLYFKQADLIADFLTVIGARSAAMTVMTARVDREMRNMVTRQINCDSANADKVVAAAQEQIAAIRRLMEGPGLDSLPEALQETALLRIANPEASLADLSVLSSPSVSKGCLAYRLKKLAALAEELCPGDEPGPEI